MIWPERDVEIYVFSREYPRVVVFANKEITLKIFVIQTYYYVPSGFFLLLFFFLSFFLSSFTRASTPITLRTIKHPARITGFDLVRRNATRGHVYDDDDDPVTKSTTWLSPRRCHLVDSILPRDALPAETASYARKRLGTTPCLASIRSSRLAHRVFLYGDLPPVHTGTATLRRENNYRKIRGYTPASCEIRCFFSVRLFIFVDRV